jgi:hypothetical protein
MGSYLAGQSSRDQLFFFWGEERNKEGQCSSILGSDRR